jgi:hypothetical protein
LIQARHDLLPFTKYVQNMSENVEKVSRKVLGMPGLFRYAVDMEITP